MKMIVALFEDEWYVNFLPLSYTRPVFECRSGMFSFLERVQNMFAESDLFLFTRDYLLPTLRKRVLHPVNKPDAIDDEVLLINGSLVVDDRLKRLVKTKLSRNVLIRQQDRLAVAHLGENLAKKHAEELCKPVMHSTLERLSKECKTLESSKLRLFNYPWDLVNSCGELVKEDYSGLGKLESKGAINDRAVIYGNKRNVFVGKGSSIEAFVLLDARNGPICIGEGTTVHAGSRITGPTYIGDEVIIPSGLIREGCSIGHVCRIGGELEETIVQGHTNKYHTGFIGHAYIGEWVNMGAATTNSDLKNTYGNVQVVVDKEKVDTSSTKVGCFIGDHAKTSIGTQIYTGKTVGVASQVHGFVADDVPSFTIWAKSLGAKPVELELTSALKTQARVLARRGVKQTKEDVELLRRLFRLTAGERRKTGVAKRKFVL